ncbi:MAG: SUMF1/EgtB/PvdO family nonheme iron enzyme [Desulfomonile tiedjei]|nr:SUMF1/EgtB/PvdO family nonheme iron enzyme [Desulfomonile tiedjei]
MPSTQDRSSVSERLFRNHALAAFAAGLLVVAGTSYRAEAGLFDGRSSNSGSSAAAGAAPATPERVYEAVSAYLEGIHGKPETRKQKPSGEKREQLRQGGSPLPLKTSAVQESADQRLAALRMDRHEWELAIPAIERALTEARRAGASTDAVRLEEMLRTAQQKAADPAAVRLSVPGESVNTIGMRLVQIPAGKFLMGSAEAEMRRVQGEWNVQEAQLRPESPSHSVRLTSAFLMGKYPVTAGQFAAFVSETGYRTVAEKQGWGWVYDEREQHWAKTFGASWRNPGSEVREDDPVTLVCHQDAEAFCDWLSRKENRRYSLPTEAEWEYAARGGLAEKRFPWGDDYPDGGKLNMADRCSPVPWKDSTTDDGYPRVSPVGSFSANGYWLYDMAGSVWQPCSDFYDSRTYDEGKSGPRVDPTGPRRGKRKVVRGGNWAFGAGIARNAFRYGVDPDFTVDIAGFRVVAASDRYEYTREQVAAEPPVDTERALKLVDLSKSLTEQGKRGEARHLADKSNDPSGKEGVRLAQPELMVKSVLRRFIDVANDEGLSSFDNGLGMQMVRIPAGAFVMGSTETDISRTMNELVPGQPIDLSNEHPLHKVRITRPFLMSATEVTVGQFRKFVQQTGYVTDAERDGGGYLFNPQTLRFERKSGTSWKNPGWPVTDDEPVTMVSYEDAQAFTQWLTATEKVPYDLPTEAQWEYAARGGLATATFPWGDSLPDGNQVNYADRQKPFSWKDHKVEGRFASVAPVGSYPANSYRLYDMAGNVSEWVRDRYAEDYYRYAPEVDPEGPQKGEYRVTKGGSWSSGPAHLRCATRGWAAPDMTLNSVGFRVVIELSNPVRAFHFGDDFLTKKWVPGPDQRIVSLAVSKEEQRQAPASSTAAERSDTRHPAPPSIPVQGVVILDFGAKSSALRAGLTKGDVIVEYDGERQLTAERLEAHIVAPERRRIKPRVAFVRDGVEYTVTLPSRSLGVIVSDKTILGPFKKPRHQPEETTDTNAKRRTKPQEWM